MPASSLSEEPAALRNDVVAFGDLVRDQLRRALSALDTLDPELARTVVDGDRLVNERYLDLERDCIELLALHQPVASDLRTVVAAFKILTDLERIADLAANLASLVGPLLHEVTSDTFAAVRLVEIGELASEMVADALYAFETGDADLCRAVVERDTALNSRCQNAMETLVRQLLEPRRTEPFANVEPPVVQQVLVLVRDLERTGDHATNIAARTYYAIKADDTLLQ
ncbi:phosphate signaling complex protein PhoU [Halapricum hydrolyticum]|uniref:Phosphate-specific transport system accessory protein PhoU n=1 Tax=Halapricum hydrolyticum TaxID=2979991 RepID=A0AAE3LE38_9EURY|nr:phosphate signaling complex protein PhoU [Halapricum hydrolyticum]MCU4716484.1 phosphate signaling complex protein PhoU [Halapricum hydrolyticum]MCU4725911.1 phosphate signaling complex protein PhoU [Halapricum hydrolyticum]